LDGELAPREARKKWRLAREEILKIWKTPTSVVFYVDPSRAKGPLRAATVEDRHGDTNSYSLLLGQEQHLPKW
jgi:hypothetical protein